jgi:sugar/nucleoside kinase (ribokinase family)
LASGIYGSEEYNSRKGAKAQRVFMVGLFVGLITLDFIYLAESPPSNNQKIVAMDYSVAAGGPATNASVTFNYLGNQSHLLGMLGCHPMTQLIRSDLEKYQVKIWDLDRDCSLSPAVSSIIVTQAKGDRAIISINAVRNQVDREFLFKSISPDILQGVDIVMIDGHQIVAGWAIASMAKSLNIPIVIDGGSWKPGFETILPFVDYAICSANFFPPHCQTEDEVFNYLTQFNIPHIAITHGENPITYKTVMKKGFIEIPKIPVVDTLGAGDIFHGAFCHYILGNNFPQALQKAVNIASESCKFFGTRF